MPRVNIYFTEEVHQRLKEYIAKNYSGHRAVSSTVQRAVKEFLEKELGESIGDNSESKSGALGGKG